LRSPYGKVFLNSLPPYRLTTRIEDVQRFFDEPDSAPAAAPRLAASDAEAEDPA